MLKHTHSLSRIQRLSIIVVTVKYIRFCFLDLMIWVFRDEIIGLKTIKNQFSSKWLNGGYGHLIEVAIQ